MEDHETFDVPEGWELVTQVKSNGTKVKYYTNVLGQKFYNKADLLRNIKDAKERGLSIYDPEFKASSLVGRKKSRIGEASQSNCKKEKLCSSTKGRRKKPSKHEVLSTSKKQKEAENQRDEQSMKTPTYLPDQTEGTDDECRASRRLAGLKPELRHDFVFNRPLEYIIKEKPQP